MAKKTIDKNPESLKAEWLETYNPKLVREFLIESNAIEGVYSKGAAKDAEAAWDYAKKNIEKIDDKYVLNIHGFLLNKLNPRIAGKVRDCAVWIGGDVKFADPPLILRDKIKKWCEWTNKVANGAKFKKLDDTNKAEVIKGWHIDFEEIHPFEDGNGRTGRILMNIQMYKNNLPLFIIHEGDEQLEYYQWFRNRKWERAIRNL